MLKVHCVQVCHYDYVIAELHERDGVREWRIPTRWDAYEITEDEAEVEALYRAVTDPDFGGYMMFRAREYGNVTVCVVL